MIIAFALLSVFMMGMSAGLLLYPYLPQDESEEDHEAS